MLCLNQTTGYAILALSCLDGCEGRWVLAKSIAQCTGIPQPYLSKLLNALTRSRLITAKRGYRGGFQLALPAEAVPLLDVVEAVESEGWLSRCLLGLEECNDSRACPTHELWKKQRALIKQELSRLTLRDMADFERQRGVRLNGCGCESSVGAQAGKGLGRWA